MPAELRPAIDTVWVLVSASLIFFMQAGFALIEAGVTSAKNIGNILMKNLMDFVVVAIVFYAAGFAIMFGDGNPFFGTGGWFGDGNPFGALAAAQVPIEAKLLFQLMFAAVAATIVSGAMVERTRFLPYLLACACVGSSSTRSSGIGSGAAGGSPSWASSTSPAQRWCTPPAG
jgi:Amt family ammonium transporter